MRVLLTNWRLEQRAGSELYLLDVARWLRDHGHVPVAYAARQGGFVDEIRRESIAVIDDPRLMAEAPDVIHGQHHLATMTAIARFPEVPVVAFCHGWEPFEEMPIRHPSIRRYVAVSAHTRERMVLESGIDPTLVSVVPNFVDTSLFSPRQSLPDRPRRALVFSNYAAWGLEWVQAIVEACQEEGISVEIAGLRSKTSVDHPEQYLQGFDLVFGKARAAMEAMATGAAVIVCDFAGLGPMAAPENFDALCEGNFGISVLRAHHDKSQIVAEIRKYDPGRARAVSDLVRDTLALDLVAPRLVELYREAVADTALRPTNEGERDAAMGDYLYRLNRLDPVPGQPMRDHYEEQLKAAHEALATAQERGRSLPSLEARLSTSDADRMALRIQLEGIAAQNKDLRARMADLQPKVAELDAELHLMRSSTSWRATRPLRAAIGSLRKVGRRNRAC